MRWPRVSFVLSITIELSDVFLKSGSSSYFFPFFFVSSVSGADGSPLQVSDDLFRAFLSSNSSSDCEALICFTN